MADVLFHQLREVLIVQRLELPGQIMPSHLIQRFIKSQDMRLPKLGQFPA